MSIIRSSVLEAWHDFSAPLEGRVPYMYVDILGLVTTGVGNLIDSPTQALRLPWQRPDGTLAPADEVRKHWEALKNARGRLSKLHHKYTRIFFENAFGYALTLSDEAIDELVRNKLEENANYLKAKHFPQFDTYAADLQIVLLSMAWAVGPGFPVKFPMFSGAVRTGASPQALANRCAIKTEGNPGVVPRNYLNMAHLLSLGAAGAGDPNELRGPKTLAALPAWEKAHGIKFVNGKHWLALSQTSG